MTFCRPVVLDACVLVGAGLRDTLLRLAEAPALYAPRWSDDILREVERTLQSRFGKTIEQTHHLTHQLRESFPEAWVREYSDLIPNLINHQKDRHVLAAAVRCGAEGIVTFNTRDFPADALCRFDIQVIHPDKFLVEQLCQNETLVVTRFSEQTRNIGRTVEDQTRAFHRTSVLPRFTLALAKALGIQLG
jgi:predicted nucleic acid-binding protein